MIGEYNMHISHKYIYIYLHIYNGAFIHTDFEILLSLSRGRKNNPKTRSILDPIFDLVQHRFISVNANVNVFDSLMS